LPRLIFMFGHYSLHSAHNTCLKISKGTEHDPGEISPLPSTTKTTLLS
jgi:hypothetical protein